MNLRRLVLVLGLVLMALTPLSAAGSVPVTGTATSCSQLAVCSFTLTSSTGTGWASTSAFVGGYVGQPVAFSGGSVSYQLPGQAKPTYLTGAYSGQGVVIGYSTTAGTLYNMTGTFSGTDANTGTLVSGSTSTVVGIMGHSGRGGGNTYTLVSGSISVLLSTQRGSTTSVVCTPSSIVPLGKSVCKVTVSDLSSVNGVTPTGKVILTMGPTGYGHLSRTSCLLSTAGTCTVRFTAGNIGALTVTITATYKGDSVHASSTGSGAITIID